MARHRSVRRDTLEEEEARIGVSFFGVQRPKPLPLRNGGSDGAGQPNPVTIDPLEKITNLSGAGVDQTGTSLASISGKGMASYDTSLTSVQDSVGGSSVATLPPGALDVGGDDPTAFYDESLVSRPEATDPTPPTKPTAATPPTPPTEATEATEPTPPTAKTKATPPTPATPPTGMTKEEFLAALNKRAIDKSGERVGDLDDAINLLSEGKIDDLITEYQKLVKLGPPPQPTMQGPSGLERDRIEVHWGTTFEGNKGYGYYTDYENELSGETEVKFVMTAASARAGEDYDRAQQQFEQMEAFLEQEVAAQTEDARTLIAQEHFAYLNDAIADENRIQAQLNTIATQELIGGIQADLQETAIDATALQNKLQREMTVDENRKAEKFIVDVQQAFQRGEREAAENFIRDFVQTFAKDERLAAQDFITEVVQKFQTEERAAGQEFTTEERAAREEFTTEERKAAEAFARDLIQGEGGSQEFATKEREAGELFAGEQREEREEFATGEREAGELFAGQESLTQRGFLDTQRLAAEGFRRGERVDAELYATRTAEEVADLAEQRAIDDREDRQRNETLQRQQAEEFTAERDKLAFDRTSRLESVRLGIADATSDEGIARAIELADEVRQLERSSAMLDVIERIVASGLGRQMAQSGLLEQLSEEFGIDLSFLISGGLGIGLGGGMPIRVTA